VHKLAPSCCRLIIFVQQSAKSISPTHPCVSGKRRPRELFLLPCLELQRTVRSQAVVMRNVDREDVLGVASGEDEQPVQALRAHGSDPSRPFPSGWCPARDSNLRTMPPAYGRNPRVNYPCRTPVLPARSWDFCGILLLERTSAVECRSTTRMPSTCGCESWAVTGSNRRPLRCK
jgi:hypothetical protein